MYALLYILYSLFLCIYQYFQSNIIIAMSIILQTSDTKRTKRVKDAPMNRAKDAFALLSITYRYPYKSTSPIQEEHRIENCNSNTCQHFSLFSLTHSLPSFIYSRQFAIKSYKTKKELLIAWVLPVVYLRIRSSFLARSLSRKAASFHMSINRFPCYRCKYSINGYISHSRHTIIL